MTTTTRPGEGVRSGTLGPALLLGGAGILLYRTIALLAGEARVVLKRWVIGLTALEMVVDLITMSAAVRWLRTRTPGHAHLPLRAGAVATLVHAVRVLVYVLGRTGPWVDFDVRPEHRADHRRRWRWAEVVFAGVTTVLGIVGMVVIWRFRRTSRR